MGGLSVWDVIRIFYWTPCPASESEIRSKTDGKFDSLLIRPVLATACSHGYVVEQDGKYSPTDKAYADAIEELTKKITSITEWREQLIQKRGSLPR